MPAPHSQVVARTEGPTTATWQLHRGTITDLYIKQNRPLKEIMYIMRVNYGLVASVKMYKYRLKAWGIRKNSRAATTGSSAAKRKARNGGGDHGSDDSKASSPHSLVATRTPSPAFVQYSTAPFTPCTALAREPRSSRITENVLQTLDRNFRLLFHPDSVYAAEPPSATMVALNPSAAVWNPPARRANILGMKHRLMTLVALKGPGLPGSKDLIDMTFQQLPQLVKQREHYSVPISMQTPLRCSRIPGAERITELYVPYMRDAADIVMGRGHPTTVIYEQLAMERSIDPHALYLFGRCVDDHLLMHYGPLHPVYLTTHLRLRKVDASPEDFADEVRALLAAGVSTTDLLDILESIFVEELFKECLYIQIRNFLPRIGDAPGHNQTTSPGHRQQSPGDIIPEPRTYPSSPSTSQPGHGQPNILSGPSNVVVPIVNYQRMISPPVDRHAPFSQQVLLPMALADVFDSLLFLIGMLQRAARNGVGLSPEELAFLRSAGAKLILPGQMDNVVPVANGVSGIPMPQLQAPYPQQMVFPSR